TAFLAGEGAGAARLFRTGSLIGTGLSLSHADRERGVLVRLVHTDAPRGLESLARGPVRAGEDLEVLLLLDLPALLPAPRLALGARDHPADVPGAGAVCRPG